MQLHMTSEALTNALNSFRPEGPPPDGFFSASLRKSRRLCRRYAVTEI